MLLPEHHFASQQCAGSWTTALTGTLGQPGCPEPWAVARGNPQTNPFPKLCQAKSSFLQPQLHLSGTNGHRGNARQQRQEGLHSCAQTAPERTAQQKQAPLPLHTTRPTQYIFSSCRARSNRSKSKTSCQFPICLSQAEEHDEKPPNVHNNQRNGTENQKHIVRSPS